MCIHSFGVANNIHNVHGTLNGPDTLHFILNSPASSQQTYFGSSGPGGRRPPFSLTQRSRVHGESLEINLGEYRLGIK